MEYKSGKIKQLLFWILYCIVFIVLPLVGLNYAAKIIVREKSYEKQYTMDAEKTDGKKHFILCHENPVNNHYDFILNREMQFFKQMVVSGEPINTTNPVFCQSYKYEMIEPEDRIKSFPPKEKGEKRLAFIGDSITFGEGVRSGDAFPEKMQTYLDFSGNREKWKILNVGRMGYDMPEIYSKCFKSALKTKPDKIVYVWFPNDMPRGRWGFPAMLRQNDMINSLNYYSRHADTLPLALLIKAKMVERETTRETVKWIANINSPANPEGVRQFRDYLRKMNKESEKAGADFSVALFPIIAGGPGKYPFSREHDFIMKLLKEENIPAADLAGDVISSPVKKLIVHPRNHHPNFLAHSNAAKALIKVLNLPVSDSLDKTIAREKNRTIRRVPSGIYEQGARSVDSLYAFYFLALFSLLYIIAISLNGGTLARAVWSENSRVNFLFVMLVIFTVAIRLWLSPRGHLVFNDEQCRLRLVEMWMNGFFYANTLNNTPGPIMYYFSFFKLLGLSITAGWIAAMAAATASCLMLYATARLLWKNDMLALLCCLLYATFPVTIRFSMAQTAENPNMLMQITVFFAIAASLRKNDLPSLFLLVVSAALLMFMRLYNGAFVLFLLFSWVYAKSVSAEDDSVFGFKTIVNVLSAFFRGLKRPKYAAAFIVSVSVFAFYAWFVYVSIKGSPYGTHVQSLSQSMPSNFASNLQFLFKNTGIPVAIVVFAIAGMFSPLAKSVCLDRKKQIVLFLCGWIMVCFLLHISSVAGGYDFDKYFDTVRYSIDFMLPLIILSALGIYTAASLIFRQKMWVGLVFVSAYILFFPVKYQRVIHYDTIYTEASKDLAMEIGNYPVNSVFYTNAFFLKNTIEMDFHKPAKLMTRISDIPESCPKGRKCVFVIRQLFENTSENNPEPYQKCFSRHIYPSGSLYFCPLKAAKELPVQELVAHDNSACFY